MKVVLILLVLSFLLSGGGLTVSFLQNEVLDPCKDGHSTITRNEIAPTCTKDGQTAELYCTVCELCVTPSEVIPATGHSAGNWKTDVAPSCLAKGSRHQSCKSCDAILAIESMDSTEHEYGAWQQTVAPTCTATGEQIRSCAHCEDVQSQALAPHTGSFSDDDWIIDFDSTCTQEGLKHTVCPDCEKTVVEKIAYKEHAFSSETLTAPTCTQNGAITQTCSKCSETKVTAIAPTGHTAGEWETVVAATATTDGIKYRYCTESTCRALLSVELLPATAASTSLQYTLDHEALTCEVTGLGSHVSPTLVIPRTVTFGSKVYTVTSIAEKAFFGKTALTSISIPLTVTHVGADAFTGCTDLLQLHNGIYYADTWAVGADPAITTLSFRASTRGIADIAFFGCERLTAATIPEHIQYIGVNPFAGCSALSSLFVASGNENYTALSSKFLLEKSSGKLITGCGSGTVALSSSIKALGDLAFFGQHDITVLNISSAVTKIGAGVFGDCPSLSTLNVAATNTVYRSVGNCIMESKTNTLVAYVNASAIPAGTVAVADMAFCGQRFTSITLPESITKIGKNPFAYCHKLVQITNLTNCALSELPDNEGLETRTDTATAFANTLAASNGLVTFTAGSTVYLIDYTGAEASLSLTGKGIQALYPYALYYNTTLTTLTSPYSITDFGEKSLYGCKSLRTVSLSVAGLAALEKQFVKALTIHGNSGNDHIPANAFENCENITSLSLTASFTFGEKAFAGCTGLQTISIPASAITAVPRTAYLTSVTITDGAFVPAYAFDNCSALTSVSLPATVVSIGACAFRNCSSLTAIAIPASVTVVGDALFEGCTKLSTFTIPTCAISLLPLSGVQSLTINGGTTIPSKAFYKRTDLKTVVIGTTVTSIGSECFRYCSSLTSFIFAAGSNLTALSNVSAIRDCTALKTLVLPEKLVSTNIHMFRGCTSLLEVWIPVTMQTIGRGSFEGCSSLATIYYGGTSTQWATNVTVESENTPVTTNKLVYSTTYY